VQLKPGANFISTPAAFFLIAVETDSTAISTVVLFCLLVSFMALSFDPLIENGHVTQPSLRRAIIS
jgi:hypothetical protein